MQISACGAQSIPHNHPHRNLKTIKGIWQVHSISACNKQFTLYIWERACYYFSCLEENYYEFKNQQALECYVHLAEQAEEGSVVPVDADEDIHCD